MTRLFQFYHVLLEAYGPQGWWPLLHHAGSNPTKTGSVAGYHPGDYSFPRNEAERFEICAGAILTQNTAWPNVEKALLALDTAGALNPEAIIALPAEELAVVIRPAGYHNSKALKLKSLSSFFLSLGNRTPTHDELLDTWGIGPETADSIRLYAYGEREMVVDAYTRRILEHLQFVPAPSSYGSLKQYCVDNLPREVPVYQEFHALLVEHAKRARTRRIDDLSSPISLNQP